MEQNAKYEISISGSYDPEQDNLESADVYRRLQAIAECLEDDAQRIRNHARAFAVEAHENRPANWPVRIDGHYIDLKIFAREGE